MSRKSIKSKLYVQYRNQNNRLVKASYRGKKRISIYLGAGNRIYRSRFYLKPKEFFEQKKANVLGFIPVDKLSTKKEWKESFIFGKFQDVKTSLFYFKKSELKGKFNASVGYYLCNVARSYELLGMPVPRHLVGKRVIIRHRIYRRPSDKVSVKTHRKNLEDVKVDVMERQKHYTDVEFVGFSVFNWDAGRKKLAGEIRDIFDYKLRRYLKAQKKGLS